MNKTIGLIAVTAVAMLLITTTAMAQGVFAHSSHHHSHHHGHGNDHGTRSNSQSLAQANSCGNGSFSSNVKCQNLGSQVQGNGNAVNVIGTQ
jgi:hypothetical protein